MSHLRGWPDCWQPAAARQRSGSGWVTWLPPSWDCWPLWAGMLPWRTLTVGKLPFLRLGSGHFPTANEPSCHHPAPNSGSRLGWRRYSSCDGWSARTACHHSTADGASSTARRRLCQPRVAGCVCCVLLVWWTVCDISMNQLLTIGALGRPVDTVGDAFTNLSGSAPKGCGVTKGGGCGVLRAEDVESQGRRMRSP